MSEHVFANTGRGMAAMQMPKSIIRILMKLDMDCFGKAFFTLGTVVLFKAKDKDYPSLLRVVSVDYNNDVVVLSDGSVARVSQLYENEINDIMLNGNADWAESVINEAIINRMKIGQPLVLISEVCDRVRAKVFLAGDPS